MIIFISTDGKRIAVTVKGSSSLLRISSTEMSDIGVYSCNHDNYRVTMVINATMAVYNKGMNGHRYVLVTHFKSKVSGRETFIYIYIYYPSFPVGGVVCPSSVDVHGIPWPIAIPGKYVHADCPNGKEGKTLTLYLHCSIVCKVSKLDEIRN